MSDRFRVQFLGNVEACRTEAEIFFPRGQAAPDPCVVMYEGRDGWIVELGGHASTIPLADLLSGLSAAREGLERYVNRRGENPPPDLTGPGLSLWLLEKADGTAMGRPIQ